MSKNRGWKKVISLGHALHYRPGWRGLWDHLWLVLRGTEPPPVVRPYEISGWVKFPKGDFPFEFRLTGAQVEAAGATRGTSAEDYRIYDEGRWICKFCYVDAGWSSGTKHEDTCPLFTGVQVEAAESNLIRNPDFRIG